LGKKKGPRALKNRGVQWKLPKLGTARTELNQPTLGGSQKDSSPIPDSPWNQWLIGLVPDSKVGIRPTKQTRSDQSN